VWVVTLKGTSLEVEDRTLMANMLKAGEFVLRSPFPLVEVKRVNRSRFITCWGQISDNWHLKPHVTIPTKYFFLRSIMPSYSWMASWMKNMDRSDIQAKMKNNGKSWCTPIQI